MEEQAKAVNTDLMGIYTELEEFQTILANHPHPSEVNRIMTRLKEINALRTHHGKFYPKPNRQATTLRLLYRCIESCVRIKFPPTQISQVDHEMGILFKDLKQMVKERPDQCSMESLHSYFSRLESFHSDLMSNLSPLSSRVSRFIDLADGFHKLTTLLLGVETVSESLISLYSRLNAILNHLKDLEWLALSQDERSQAQLDTFKKQIQDIKAAKNTEGAYFGDCADIGLSSVPRGQTIIKSLIAECESRTSALYGML